MMPVEEIGMLERIEKIESSLINTIKGCFAMVEGGQAQQMAMEIMLDRIVELEAKVAELEAKQ